MKILAIEASGPVAGCAVLEDGLLIADYNVQYKKKHAQSLVPMMEEVKQMLELDLQSVDAIAVTKGPGSFTGLRIGAATAKGAAFAMNRPVIPVPTVDSIAYNLYGTKGLICPLMDARRQQVYTGIYSWEKAETLEIPETSEAPETSETSGISETPEASETSGISETSEASETSGKSDLLDTLDPFEKPENRAEGPAAEPLRMKVLRPQCVIPVSEVIDDLNARGREVVFLGDGVPVSREMIAERMKVPYSFAPAHLARQRAAAVAALAYSCYEEQGAACMVSADDFRPEYLRLAQAEQEHSERRSFSLLL